MPFRRDVTHYTESPTKEYSSAIRRVKNFKALRRVLRDYPDLCGEGIKRLRDCKPGKEWTEWRLALKLCREPFPTEAELKWSNDEWGEVFMPSVMMQLELNVQRFKVPWGTVYIRCRKVCINNRGRCVHCAIKKAEEI